MMKKITPLIIALVFSISFVNAQSYTLSWEEVTLGDTVTISGDPANMELVFHAILTNNSENTVTFDMKRRLIYLLDSTATSYCWGHGCSIPNPDSIVIARDTVILAPGGSTSEEGFSGHYVNEDWNKPIGAIGTSLIEYTFFNVDNEDEYVTVVAKFVTAPDGVIDQIMADGFISDMYPNPATHFINLDYELTSKVNSASIRVMNLLGSVVKNVEIDKNSTNLRLDISNLTKGVYFYSVIINNEVYKTKKLIVR